jgi:hypothetical protein
MLTNISSKKEQRSRRIVILLGCLIILGLSSCLQSNTKLNPTVTPLSTTIPTSTFVLPTTTLPPPVEPSLTSTPTSIATSSPPAILVSTLRAYPTRIGVGEYPGQVTDGILLFSVEKVTDRCYKSLEAIKLKFIFKNLTDKAIKIPNDFSIALDRNGNGGSLLPYITSAEGLDLLSDADILAISIFSPPSDRYLTLLGNQEFETVLINRCKTNLQASQTTGLMKLPSPSTFPNRGSINRDDGESDTTFSGAIELSAMPDALV